MKNEKSHIATKVKNNTPIRVLYKKTGQPPEIRIINNIFKLKKTIVTRNLDIIPYEKLYIICNNKKLCLNEKSNIVLTFNSIYGNLILIDIDKQKREFKGLSQNDIIWYSQDLINKSSNYNIPTKPINKFSKQHLPEIYNHDFQYTCSQTTNFEKTLINVLVNIELVLATILKNGDNKKNE